MEGSGFRVRGSGFSRRVHAANVGFYSPHSCVHGTDPLAVFFLIFLFSLLFSFLPSLFFSFLSSFSRRLRALAVPANCLLFSKNILPISVFLASLAFISFFFLFFFLYTSTIFSSFFL